MMLASRNQAKIKEMIAEIPNEKILEDGTVLYVCSEIRKTFYLKQAEIRFDKILKPAYERAMLKQNCRIQNEEQEKSYTQEEPTQVFT